MSTYFTRLRTLATAGISCLNQQQVKRIQHPGLFQREESFARLHISMMYLMLSPQDSTIGKHLIYSTDHANYAPASVPDHLPARSLRDACISWD